MARNGGYLRTWLTQLPAMLQKITKFIGMYGWAITTAVLLLPLLTFAVSDVSAESNRETDLGNSRWYIQGGGYLHYSEDEEFEGPPWFTGVEYFKSEKLLFGFSIFNNSFGDTSQYAYVGRNFHPWDANERFRIKLTIGVAHGYYGEHQKVMPINWGDGWGIGVVPTVGYQINSFGFDVGLLSASGVLFLVGYNF